MLAEVRSHQDAGRPAFIVSAASNGVVELLARVLDMEGGIGTRYEVDADGRYTGRLIGGLNYGELKIEPMRRFAADHGIDIPFVTVRGRRGGSAMASSAVNALAQEQE